jgi:hypothetical protein
MPSSPARRLLQICASLLLVYTFRARWFSPDPYLLLCRVVVMPLVESPQWRRKATDFFSSSSTCTEAVTLSLFAAVLMPTYLQLAWHIYRKKLCLCALLDYLAENHICVLFIYM